MTDGMTEIQRWRKRAVILLVALLIAGGLALLFRGVIGVVTGPPPATCTDGILNQNEEEADCGGSCAPCFLRTVRPVAVERSAVFPNIGKSADAVVWLRNPNATAGAARVPYRVEIRDAAGGAIGTVSGEAFLLPGEEQFFVHPRVSVQGVPVSAVAIVEGAEWRALDRGPRAVVAIQGDRLEKADGAGSVEWIVRGVVRNDSAITIDRIGVAGLLQDTTRAIVGAGRTEMRTVRPQERRAFELTWPVGVVRNPATVELRAQTNIFEQTNLLLEFGAGEKQPFQRF